MKSIPDIAAVRNLDYGGPDFIWRNALEKARARRDGNTLQDISRRWDYAYDGVHRFCEAWLDDTYPVEALLRNFPAMYNAHNMWNSSEASSPRWHIEAMLMIPNITYAEIAEYLGEREHALTAAIYDRVFFDCGRHLLNEVWMNMYVWRPSMERSDDLYLCDYLYKGIAYYKGKEDYLNLITPKPLERRDLLKLLEFVEAEQTRGLLTMARDNATLRPEERVPVGIGVAHKLREDVVREEPGGGAKIEDWQKMCRSIMDRVRLMASDESLPAREELNYVKKYDKKDL
jgi:hypothetical protein